jgi:hypothetical protein
MTRDLQVHLADIIYIPMARGFVYPAVTKFNAAHSSFLPQPN